MVELLDLDCGLLGLQVHLFDNIEATICSRIAEGMSGMIRRRYWAVDCCGSSYQVITISIRLLETMAEGTLRLREPQRDLCSGKALTAISN